MLRLRIKVLSTAVLSALLVIGAAASAGAGTSARTATGNVKTGGMLTVLVNNGSWPQLDTATDPEQLADARMLNDIDGQLFEQGPNGSIVDDLATGYKYSDHNLAVTIELRHGVKFQDGSPFNAQAVAFNINRDLLPANACLCLTLFSSVQSVTASGQYNVVLNLKAPYAPLIDAFINNAPNEPESMVALEGESLTAFGQHPIGAGPFKIVSMVPSTNIVLTKNPGYWEKGHPYLSGITFQSTSSDQSDLEAVQTGQAQQTAVTTIPLVTQIKQNHALNIFTLPSTTYYLVLFNSTIPPFNNLLVREALSYATDPKLLVRSVYDGVYPTMQAMCTRLTTYCPSKISSYDGYDVTKAKAAMAQYTQQTGKPFPTIPMYSFLPTNATLTEAVASEWNSIGITTTISVVSVIPDYVNDFRANTWPIWVENDVQSSTDPATGTFCQFGVMGLFTGVDDPTLQGMLNRAEQLVNPTVRATLYKAIFTYIDKMAYGVPIYQSSTFTISAKNVEGVLNGTSNAPFYDENVWLK